MKLQQVCNSVKKKITVYQFLKLSQFFWSLCQASLIKFQPPQAHHFANIFGKIPILLTEEENKCYTFGPVLLKVRTEIL